MALFKIEKGLAANLATNRPNTTEGYCYVTTDDGKFYIDTATANGTDNRIVLNAGTADKTIGSLTINDSNGTELCSFNGEENKIINLPEDKKGSLTINFEDEKYDSVVFDGKNNTAVTIPNGFKEPMVLTANVSYGDALPDSAVEGQLFFLEESLDGPTLPQGGTVGQVLIKNSSEDGDASWKDIVALPKGGTMGQVLSKKTETDGDAEWSTITPDSIGAAAVSSLNNYLPLSGGTVTGNTSIRNMKFLQSTVTSGTTSGTANTLYIHGPTYGNTSTDIKTAGKMSFGDPGPQIVFGTANENTSGQRIALIYTDNDSIHKGNSLSLVSTETDCAFIAPKVYGAVYNDYAEYRQTVKFTEPGRCVVELGDGSLGLSYKRLEPGAEIISDTFGFAIGETKECKTPIAVSGRVLAYPNEPRETYKAGDPVCSGPNGTVSKMTREEVREYPDRMIGTVSEIPTYETWGQENVKVNGRIWIRIR